jgi:hypothetical protein
MATPPSTRNDPNHVQSSPHPIFNEHDCSVPRGLSFFEKRKSNIINIANDPHITWKSRFGNSQMLSWEDGEKDGGAIDFFVIGHLLNPHLVEATGAKFGPAYRLDLVIDCETSGALQTILENGPHKDSMGVSPLVRSGNTVSFSVKMKTLNHPGNPQVISENEPFPSLFDGQQVVQGQNLILKGYSASDLKEDDILAVETNLMSYIIEANDDYARRLGYSLSIRSIFFLGKEETPSTPEHKKRPGPELVSPRRYQKPGQVVSFSDED